MLNTFLNSSVNAMLIYAIGTIGVFILTTGLGAIVWNIVNKWFRNGNGNRRSDNNVGWPNAMVEKLTKIDMNIDIVAKTLSSNGIARVQDVGELKQMLRSCQEIHGPDR